MTYDPARHHRRSTRLPGYDYTQAKAYFVTIVTRQRESLFGEVDGDQVKLNPVGQMIQREWKRLEKRFPGVELDHFTIMPNHVHGIIVFRDHDTGSRGAAASAIDPGSEVLPLHPYNTPTNNVIPGSLGAIVRAFKSSTAYRYNRMRVSSGLPLWQRNYYDRVIRSEAEWDRIRRYIQGNPAQWADDRENPTRYAQR